MESTKSKYKIKVLAVGPSGTGKTSFLTKVSDNIFTSDCISTIGVDFIIVNYNENGSQIKLQIWDTAGRERFREITT